MLRIRALLVVGVVVGALLVLAALPAGAITLGQVDDFQDGTDGNWNPNGVLNIAAGGPSGVDDAFVQYSSSGGAGSSSKMVVTNETQWAGDYASAGVGKITLDAVNKGSTALTLRIAIGTPASTSQGSNPAGNGTWYASTTAVTIPATNLWTPVEFSLEELDMTKLLGSSSFFNVISGVTQLRILSSSSPSNRGDAVAGTLGVDNISAIPEPSTALLLSLGLTGLVCRSRMRGARAA